MNLDKGSIRDKIKRLTAEGKPLPKRLKQRAREAGVNIKKVAGKVDAGDVAEQPANDERKEHADSNPIKGYNIDKTKGLIGAQNEANIDAEERQQEWNRVNEQDAYGGAQYTQNDDGTWTRNVSLNDQEQAKLDQNRQFDLGLGDLGQQMLGGAGQMLRQPADFSGLPQMPGQGGFSQDRMRIENSIMDRFNERMQPQFDKQVEQAEQRLASMGIARGSEKWQQEMDNINRQQNDARSQNALGAMQFGGQEQRSQYDMGMGARNQGIYETLTQRSLPLSELGQVWGMRGGVNDPRYSGISQIGVNPTNVAGIWQGNKGLELTGRGQDLSHSAQMAAINKPHAGGGGHDPFALAAHNANLQRENMIFQHELQGNGGQSRAPSAGQAAGVGAAQGVAAGAGAAFR